MNTKPFIIQLGISRLPIWLIVNVFAKLKEILPVRLIKESTNKVNFKFKLIKVTPDNWYTL